jgi:hypothetical protein
MIGQYLPNNNEKSYNAVLQNFLDLNRPLVTHIMQNAKYQLLWTDEMQNAKIFIGVFSSIQNAKFFMGWVKAFFYPLEAKIQNRE